jgi:hypothetical protein
VRSVHVTNDTRSEQGRTDEIYQTIEDLLTAASKQPGFALDAVKLRSTVGTGCQ